MPMHFGGFGCDMKRILAVAERHGLRVVEDAAHAPYSEYAGRMLGTFGDIGVFSFYVTKNVVTGEGGSGGALAIAVGDRVLMMENAIYSVISPEGCASIMWRDASKRELACEAMRITSGDLSEFRCVDDIVPEPAGGAQIDWDAAARMLDQSLQKHLSELQARSIEELLAQRYDKFRKIAQCFTE